MINKGLASMRRIHVGRKYKIISENELQIDDEPDTFAGAGLHVTSNIIDKRLLANVEFMNSCDWKYISIVQETETSLQVHLWKVICEKMVTAVRSEDVFTKLADEAFERAQEFVKTVRTQSFSTPCNIMSDATFKRYEAYWILQKLKIRLTDADFVVSCDTRLFPAVDKALSAEEVELLQMNGHFTHHAEIHGHAVWAFLKLTDSGKMVVWNCRREKAHTTHMLHPMATDIRNIEKNQRVYVNVGYRDGPIPSYVEVLDTCLCVDKLKKDRKMFYMFRHICGTVSADGEFTKTFLLPVNPPRGEGPYLSVEPLGSTHRKHKLKSSRMHYTSAGMQALGIVNEQ